MSQTTTRRKTVKVEEFINTYYGLPCLWNTKTAEYRNHALKINAYDELALKFNMSVAEVKSKINSLRTTYKAERAKEKASKTKGAGGDAIYVSTICWLPLMDFLKDVIQSRNTKSKSNIRNRKVRTAAVSNNQIGEPSTPGPNSRVVVTVTAADDGNVQEVLVGNEEQFIREAEEEEALREAQVTAADTVDTTALKHKRMSEKREIIEVLQSLASSQEDEWDKFGAFIAEKLRQMPAAMSSALQMEIMSVVCRAFDATQTPEVPSSIAQTSVPPQTVSNRVKSQIAGYLSSSSATSSIFCIIK